MTAHSPVGMNPEKFKVKKATEAIGSFANNDIVHIDTEGCDHEQFGAGLRKSLFNYMHGMCYDYPLQEWFDFKVPKTTVAPYYIQSTLDNHKEKEIKPSSRIVWLGGIPVLSQVSKKIKGRQQNFAKLKFNLKRGEFSIQLDAAKGVWLKDALSKISLSSLQLFTVGEIAGDFNANFNENFDALLESEPLATLRQHGLLVL